MSKKVTEKELCLYHEIGLISTLTFLMHLLELKKLQTSKS